MKEYTKPIIKEEEVVLDIIAQSFGDDLPGDKEVPNFWS
jgi:hypothetical protein